MQKAVNKFVSQIVNNGIRQIIICPGSRNAPLTLAFTRHPDTDCYSLIDERSAAFTALGMAVALKKPVAIVCTSGTAVLNLYPAIAEAYYSQIPLLIITADRPANRIDQWDGQCIRQNHIFEKHIIASFTFDPLNPKPDFNQEIRLCSYPKRGPVHINVPIDEPIYEGKNNEFNYDTISLPAENVSYLANNYPSELKHKKIMLFAGADALGERLKDWFEKINREHKILILADVISGLHTSQTVANWDLICTLAGDDLRQQLKPDLLITVGKYTVSKGFKDFISQNKPDEHWHITDNQTIADPFQTDPKEIKSDEPSFLKWLLHASKPLNSAYPDKWLSISGKSEMSIKTLFNNSAFNDFSATSIILELLPQSAFLHLSNSMPIRFASFLAEKLKDLKIYGNRGTSGIEGSTSTAAGSSMVMQSDVFLLTGDLSFFYDINGLWNRYLRQNFKIIVLNNCGGGIFRLINGPDDLPEREDYFSTQSKRNCRRLADEFGFMYYKADDFVSLRREFETFCKDETQPGILEIFTEPDSTVEFYKKFKDLKI